MSVLQMSKVWALDLPHNHLWVLMALADHADDQGQCWPGVDRIAWKCGSSTRQVQRILRQLVEDNLLTVRDRSGRGATNYYVLHLDNAPQKPPLDASVPSERLRLRIIERDKETCNHCGRVGTSDRDPDGRAWHVDRIIPGALGGGYVEENVVLSCANCNLKRKSPKNRRHNRSKRSELRMGRQNVTPNKRV
jgi:hypothetical protein